MQSFLDIDNFREEEFKKNNNQFSFIKVINQRNINQFIKKSDKFYGPEQNSHKVYNKQIKSLFYMYANPAFTEFHKNNIYQTNLERMLKFNMKISDLQSVYSFDKSYDKINYKAFISQSTQILLQNKFITKDELLDFYFKDTENYRPKKAKNIFFNNIVNILIDPFFQLKQKNGRNKIFNMTFNVLLPFCKSSSRILQSYHIEKLKEGLKEFTYYCITIVEEHQSDQSDEIDVFLIRNEVKKRFNDLIKYLGIRSRYKNMQNITENIDEKVEEDIGISKIPTQSFIVRLNLSEKNKEDLQLEK